MPKYMLFGGQKPVLGNDRTWGGYHDYLGEVDNQDGIRSLLKKNPSLEWVCCLYRGHMKGRWEIFHLNKFTDLPSGFKPLIEVHEDGPLPATND